MRLLNVSNGAELGSRIEVAFGRRDRRKGLLGRDSLEPGGGMAFPRCRQVHTFGMRFRIDLVFLDGRDTVIRTCKDVSPGRLSPLVLRSRMVVELPAGTCETTATVPGHRIDLIH